MKRLLFRITSCLLVCCVCVMPFLNCFVSAAEQPKTNPDLRVIGASVEFNEDDSKIVGIRYTVGIDETTFGSLSDSEKNGFRLLVMPQMLVDGELEADEVYRYQVGKDSKTTSPIDVLLNWDNVTYKNGYAVADVVVRYISNKYYNKNLVARAYCEDENGNPVYSESFICSYAELAVAALNNTNGGYNAAQRNLLLGIAFEKQGTWDYSADDMVLSTNGSEIQEDENLLHPTLFERSQKIKSSESIINAGFYVGIDGENPFLNQPDGTDTSIKGLVFGYDAVTKAGMYFDFRYRNLATPGWYPSIRVFDGEQWSNYIGSGAPLNEGWYDFRITVDSSDGYAKIIVEAKQENDGHYKTIINTSSNNDWNSSKPQIKGEKVGFTSTIQGQTLKFKPEISVTNDAVQLRGSQTKKIVGKLNSDGTGTIKGSFVHDFRTTGSNIRREGIKFSGENGNGYYFWIGDQPNNATPRFYIAMWRWNGSDFVNTNMKDGGVVPSYAETGAAGVLQENDEILVDYEIKIYIDDSGKKHFDTDFTLSSGSWSWTGKYYCYDNNATYLTGSDIYYCSEDNGLETDTNQGDGKTIYYKTNVTSGSNIEKSTQDMTIEDINVFLNESAKYSNPISDENQPYRDGSLEAQRLEGSAEKTDRSMTGDPYILRYNGKFYLYCSTDSWYCSYRCWESLDLIHYTYLGKFNLLDKNGNVTQNDDSTNQGYALECPWAPEVHYWNGQFYMYTSPHASGHKAFISTTGLPYGDFKVVNDNLYKGIDGSMFIDDNEQKWFIAADRTDADSCPIAIPSTNMTTVNTTETVPLSKAAITGDQIEGPFVFKRNGIYYFIGAGEGTGEAAYRINYAYNESGISQSSAWQTEINPTLVLNTEGDYVSYGHGAVTVGPDLDSYWLPYHMNRNFGSGSVKQSRTLGINRIEFSGTRMNVIGQDKENYVPDAPAFYTSYFTALSDKDANQNITGVVARAAGYRSYTDARTNAGEGLYSVNGKLLSGNSSTDLIKTGSRFTAEYNFKDIATNGSFKCLFGGGYVTINGKKVELYKGSSKIAEANMLVNGESWDWSAYHSIVVTCEPGRITVAVDGCTKIDEEATGFGNDAIGYEGATLSQIGGAVFSNQAFGSSDKETAKTADGSFFASNYYTAKDGESASNISASSYTYKIETEDGEDEVSYSEPNMFGANPVWHIYKDATALKLAQGDRAVYKIYVSESATYSLESLLSVNSNGSIIKVQFDKQQPNCYKLNRNDYSAQTFNTEYYNSLQFEKRVIDNVYLQKGLHTVTIKAVQGDFTAIEYALTRISSARPNYSDSLSSLGGAVEYGESFWKRFNSITNNWLYYPDYENWVEWDIKDDAYYAAAGSRNLARFGITNATDYKAKVEIKTDAVSAQNGTNAGILLRLTNPSISSRQTYGSGRGYYVCLDAEGVKIIRFDYSEVVVAEYSADLSSNAYYTLEAECIGNTISVMLNGKKIIKYVDPYAYICGAVGLYSNDAETYFKNLVIDQSFGNTSSPYIREDDSRYQVVKGDFEKLNSDVISAGYGESIMIDKSINTSSKDLYAFNASFKVVPNTASAVNGIIFNYSGENGSYLALNYCYVNDEYRLCVNHFDGNEWDSEAWITDVVLNENEWYSFDISVQSQSNTTTVDIRYQDENDKTVYLSDTFAFAMSGRKVGYVANSANNMLFGITNSVTPFNSGTGWSDDWSEALDFIKG